MNPRIRFLQARLHSSKLDAFLVTDDIRVTYLLRSPSHESWLLVLPDRTYYLTDARYYEEARATLKNVRVCLCRRFLQDAAREVGRCRAKRIGFDERGLSLYLFRQFKAFLPDGVTLLARNRLIDELRMIKDREEAAQIRGCVRLNRQLYACVQRGLKPGLSEYDILRRMEGFIRAKGVGFSFPPIVASGPNSAYPHARVTDRKMLKNDILLVDVGIEQNGYKSDLTRMFFLGKITPLMRKVYDAVAAAQRQAFSVIRPGIAAAAVDAQARKSLKERKLSGFFCHALGHGVGLEVHEAPSLSPRSRTALKPGMVFTLEPGVYLPGQFGVRIEDMVLVSERGAECLSDEGLARQGEGNSPSGKCAGNSARKRNER